MVLWIRQGAQQCSQSWECRGARLCERAGWCSGYDRGPSSALNPGSAEVPDFASALDGALDATGCPAVLSILGVQRCQTLRARWMVLWMRQGAQQCSQSWECRGARLCERGGWCSGCDRVPSSALNPGSAEVPDFASAVDGAL